MIVLTLALTAALCLTFASTRVIGVVFIAILATLFPWPILSLLIVGGIVYFFFFNRSRSHKNAITKLP